jgi:hypothetical protein
MVHLGGVQVFLDGEPLSATVSSVAAAIAEGASAAATRGRVVIEVHADGVLLDESRLDARAQEPESGDAGQVRELRLTSADPYLLVQATLDDAAAAVQQLSHDQQRAARLVHQDKLQDAVAQLQQVFQTWQTVKDVTERASSLLGEDLLAMPVESALGTLHGQTLSAELLTRLRAVKVALSREDWSRFADLLGHELVDASQRWHELLRGLARHVGELRGVKRAASPTLGGAPA